MIKNGIYSNDLNHITAKWGISVEIPDSSLIKAESLKTLFHCSIRKHRFAKVYGQKIKSTAEKARNR